MMFITFLSPDSRAFGRNVAGHAVIRTAVSHTVTDYTSACQAPRRDFVAEYVHAFRAAGLRVGLYYSLGDFRVPAYWNDPAADPAGWEAFRDYVHQIRFRP